MKSSRKWGHWPAHRQSTGQVLLEVRMNVFYRLRIDLAGDIKIVMVKVFLETDPAKVARLTQLYRIGP